MDNFDLRKYLSNNPLLNEIKVNTPGDINKLTYDQKQNLPPLNLTIGKYDISKGRVGKQVSPNSPNISDATRNRALIILNKLGIKPEKAWVAFQTYNSEGGKSVDNAKSTFILSYYNGETILIAQTQTESPMAGQIYIYSKYFKSGKALRLPDGEGGNIDTSSLYTDKNATKEQILQALKIPQ